MKTASPRAGRHRSVRWLPTLLAALALPAGAEALQRLGAEELARLALGNTLRIEGESPFGPFHLALHIGEDGRGWQRAEGLSGNLGPDATDRVARAHVAPDGSLCRLRTEALADVPEGEYTPRLLWACNALARDADGRLWVTPAAGGPGVARVVAVEAGDTLPTAHKAAWEQAVRERFGGAAPAWAEPPPPPFHAIAKPTALAERGG